MRKPQNSYSRFKEWASMHEDANQSNERVTRTSGTMLGNGGFIMRSTTRSSKLGIGDKIFRAILWVIVIYFCVFIAIN
ncbi:hypothetical protein HWC59_gp10 [Proteus phage Myduc]|uniref:Uncharacterized protein n=1 Tax=Proteus phage Myduc TaxID=2650874 RepID=A0A5J6T773_9CAUD|nr:hypothetical protein HWC59_gp10 [Proteus phage Myduc]QFG06633.1 hypothetical protein CPT_Myduc_010 [Proteus phage Myduc]